MPDLMQARPIEGLNFKEWTEQLRFEIQTLAGSVQNAAYLLFVGIIYLQFITTLTILLVVNHFMDVPDWFWRVFLSLVFLLLVFVAAGYAHSRDSRIALASDYQELLSGIYMGQVDLATVGSRFRTLKEETPSRLKFWRRSKK